MTGALAASKVVVVAPALAADRDAQDRNDDVAQLQEERSRRQVSESARRAVCF